MTLFADLVATSGRVADTSSRNAKTHELAAFLRRLEPQEIEIVVAFLSGEPRQGRIGIGYELLREGRPPTLVETPSLTIADVDALFQSISETTGSGSKSDRIHIWSEFLARSTADERDFVGRLVVGELRQGALESLMIDAVGEASSLPAASVRQAAMVAHGITAVARAAMTEGAAGLRRFSLAVMHPFAPMLAQPASSIADALAKLGTAAVEWKLDGARIQAHKSGDDVRIFTRSRNDVTDSAPEIVERLRSLDAQELILDGEAIALRANGASLPFQTTMRRFGRTLDVSEMRASLPLSAFFFDCLRLNDDALNALPASERFEALERALPPDLRMPRIVTGNAAEAEAFYDDVLARGHEGIMIKSLTSPYEAGRRAPTWLKLKRTHTLDLVVLAAEWGHGRRSGFLSNLHLGASDSKNPNAYVMLGKTFKGMTDEMLRWQTDDLLAREVSRDEWTVYTRPELVVEVAFNDLQASPRYPGGLALRFARVKRYRPDKTAGDADTMETVRAIYQGQVAREGDEQ